MRDRQDPLKDLSVGRSFTVLLTAIVLTAVPAVQADPATDIGQSREFFKKRFPSVPFEEYANGPYALPDAGEYREQWLRFNDAPTYEIGLANGKQLWETPFKNGKTFSGCFINGGKNIAQGYPRWNKATKKVRTAEMDLMDCAKRNDANLEFLTADIDRDQDARVQLAELSAYFYSLARGRPIKPDMDFSDPDALKAYEEGKKYWWSRRGQWNFACASCHIELAGKSLGGNQPLSAALGHATAWPAQRLGWGRIELLQYRYATCLSQMRAKPPKIGSEILNHVELYEKIISSGLPLRVPSMRN